MKESLMKALLALIVILAVMYVIIYRNTNDKENYSYHFGFPTWGGVNNSPWGMGWGGVRLNPFMPYSGSYYHTSISPYLSSKCYSSSINDHCVPGYRKIGIDTDDDGDKDKWQCCRRWR